MTTDQILEKFVVDVKREIRAGLARLGMNPQGAAGRSLEESFNTKTAAVIIGRHYFQQIEEGRGPTRPNFVRGEIPLYQALANWLRSKGVTDNAEGLGHYLAKRMHEKGWIESTNAKVRAAQIVTKAIEKADKDLRKNLDNWARLQIDSIFIVQGGSLRDLKPGTGPGIKRVA